MTLERPPRRAFEPVASYDEGGRSLRLEGKWQGRHFLRLRVVNTSRDGRERHVVIDAGVDV